MAMVVEGREEDGSGLRDGGGGWFVGVVVGFRMWRLCVCVCGGG